MSCTGTDWKGFVLDEMEEPGRQEAEAHLKVCGECREEVERLRATWTALAALPVEEIPRKIAFVSDKVFEPTWWQRFWRSWPQLGFASAAVLAAAILVHAFARPAAAPVPAPGPAIADTAAMELRIQEEVARRVQASFEKVAAEAGAREAERTAELLRAFEQKFEKKRQADLLAVEEDMSMLRKRWGVMYTASAELGGNR